MIDNITLLNTLEQLLQKYHPSLLRKMNKGLTDDDVEAFGPKCEITVTDELYDLFMWRNGITPATMDSIDQLIIFPTGRPISLAEAADNFDLLSVTKHLFESNYFPLFAGDNGNFLLIDLDSASPTFKTISLFAPQESGNAAPITIYDTFATLLETVIACYKQGAFRIKDGALEVDSDMHYRIAGNLNPNSQYWQYM